MHLIIATRGNKESVELFIKELSSKYMPLPFINKKTGKATMVVNPIHIRPLQLWEIIFPKEQRDAILTTLFPDKRVMPANPKFRKIYKWILKLLPKTIQKIPEDWDTKNKLYVNHNDVEIVGLGMKEDVMMNFKRGDEGMKSVGLDPKEKWEYEGL